MMETPVPELRRYAIPVLRAMFEAAVDAPKSDADDLMLSLCEALLSVSPERARAFYDNPLDTHSNANAPFYTVVREDNHTAFRYYSRRALWLSLQESSAPRLRSGLLSFALSSLDDRDWRDLLVALAPYHHCARVLGMGISELFDAIAPFAPPDLARHYREFGRRQDVTLGVFGWRAVETDHGVRFRQT